MKNSILCFVFIISSALSTFAQNENSLPSVVLCENYSEQGVTDAAFDSWTIDSLGGYVYVLYNQEKPITAKATYLQVEHLMPNLLDYEVDKTITLTPVEGKNWVVYDYFFSREDTYKFSIIVDGTTMAITYADVYFDTVNPTDTITTFYYENSFVSFCEKVVDGQMIGEAEEFPASPTGITELEVYVYSDVPFLTDFFYVDVYEGENNIDSYEVDVVSTWNYTHFIQKFNHPGTYQIDIYSGDDIYINTGEITIK